MKPYKDIPELNPEQFERFSRLVREKASINLKENKLTLLSNRLRKRLRALDLEDYDRYYAYLTGANAKNEMVHFLEVITTNETYFWRTIQNFELLKESLLPELLKMYPQEELLFWSAGCSSGEEPYNLAMELVEGMKRNGYFKYQILATDLSQRMVEFARAGRYSGRKIEKVPPVQLRRYFKEDPEKEGYYWVRHDFQERIQFKVANLFESEVKQQHCIFCRNVMIYFSREKQEELANRFYRSLKPGGFLIIGHSESLHMLKTPFTARYFEKGVVYQK